MPGLKPRLRFLSSVSGMLGAGEGLRGVVRAKAQTTFFAPQCQECWGQGKCCELLSGLKPRLRFLSSVSGMLGQGKGCEVLPGLKPRLRFLSHGVKNAGGRGRVAGCCPGEAESAAGCVSGFWWCLGSGLVDAYFGYATIC